ncbi:MAG: hypothetical protein ACT4QD_15140 [Acidobacteriota bacterium]
MAEGTPATALSGGMVIKAAGPITPGAVVAVGYRRALGSVSAALS